MGAKDINKTMTLKDRVTGTLKRINGGTVQYKRNLRDLKRSANKAWKTVKTGAMIGAAAMVGAAGASVVAANKFAATGDRIDKLSQKIGISRQSFQEWDFILSQNGASVEGLQMGLKTLSKAADEAAQGVTTYTDVFNRLNLSVTDANGNIKDQEELFNETILALSEMENTTERTALASQLLGRSAQELAPMLNSGAESVEALREKAHELGLVIGDDGVDAAVVWTDAVDQAKRAMGGLFNTLAASTMPHFNKGIQWVVDKMPSVRKFVVGAFDAIKQAIDDNTERFSRVRAAIDNVKQSITGAFSPAGEGGGAVAWMLETGIPGLVGGVAGVLAAVSDTYNFISDNWSLIGPLVYGIVGALVAYKTATMGVTAWTHVVTAAQWAWNTAMNMSPIGQVALAIGALIAVGTLLINNLDNIKLAGQKAWNGMLTGAEWMANGVIKVINWMIDQAVKPINKFIEGINKIPGVAVKPIEVGISAVDFSAAKFDVADQEFNWRLRKERGGEQRKADDPLLKALEANTAAVGGNTGALTTNTSAVNNNTASLRDGSSPVDLADSLLGRIERHIWAT